MTGQMVDYSTEMSGVFGCNIQKPLKTVFPWKYEISVDDLNLFVIQLHAPWFL